MYSSVLWNDHFIISFDVMLGARHHNPVVILVIVIAILFDVRSEPSFRCSFFRVIYTKAMNEMLKRLSSNELCILYWLLLGATIVRLNSWQLLDHSKCVHLRCLQDLLVCASRSERNRTIIVYTKSTHLQEIKVHQSVVQLNSSTTQICRRKRV